MACMVYLPVAYAGGHMQRCVAVVVINREIEVGQADEFQRDLGFPAGDDDAEQGVAHEVDQAARLRGQLLKLTTVLVADQLVDMPVVQLVKLARRLKLLQLVVLVTLDAREAREVHQRGRGWQLVWRRLLHLLLDEGGGERRGER